MAKKVCDYCPHEIERGQDHGFAYVMQGECAECPECQAALDERIAEDKKARPAQYRPVE